MEQQHPETTTTTAAAELVSGGLKNLEKSEKLVGVPVKPARDVDMAERDDGCCHVTVLKRKRGRPAKSLTKTKTKTTPPSKDDEDVCFICFDGGSLVLCDRRGCPKAYHPACIKRDEAFFQSKAKWNCGWHICSVCGKASHYMCYTCTYSLCKRCTKDADFVCVRGNKGLCGICTRTIMLIENSAQGNKAMCEVDFDDRSSWEYLFKVYWIYLKEKLSLTFDELLRAKSPWKGATPMSCMVETPQEFFLLKNDKVSGYENSSIDTESNNSKNKKSKRGDKHRHICDGVLNDIGCSTQDLTHIREPTGSISIIKNQINPNVSAIENSTNAGDVRLEASGVAAGISLVLLSTGMEQPISDFVDDKSWHYQDPTGKVQGPFSMLQLSKWNASGHFPPDLRIWKVDEEQDNSILLADALSGKFSKNVSLPYNSIQLSLEASVTLDNKENSQDGGSIVTRNGNHANSQIVEDSREQRVEDTCTQSNGKDESVRSNGWHFQSPCWTVQADGNNNEEQSGILERKEESSKGEISCHDRPHVYPSLPSTTFSEKLNENPSDKLREDHRTEGNSEDNGNCGSNRISEGQSNSVQSCQKQFDGEENSGQSSGQNWRCPDVVHPACNTSTWQAIFGDPFDFEESVSDLLAEVEAMESLEGMESPTSIMKCGEELTDGCITDCLSFALGLSPMHDAGKGDAVSSTGDLHLPSQSTTAEEPFRQADVHHHASRSSEVESTFSKISWNPTNRYSWDPNY
ncbi:zinc finger CCCH domain-containing protein 44-like [Gastrolobium bilobum]|uniref:zinc finger CCCH domain-containing protein 44-like n=1 Tax=Gastrolobium bilobum TaxID=150636 RepID=UPI002AB1AFF8|nr:zinc finger CCCH domain-containing protein 44-like [Gastrolobium bilobum]